jgi:hypothetical protein
MNRTSGVIRAAWLAGLTALLTAATYSVANAGVCACEEVKPCAPVKVVAPLPPPCAPVKVVTPPKACDGAKAGCEEPVIFDGHVIRAVRAYIRTVAYAVTHGAEVTEYTVPGPGPAPAAAPSPAPAPLPAPLPSPPKAAPEKA